MLSLPWSDYNWHSFQETVLYINMWFIIILYPVKRRRHLLEHMIGHFLNSNFAPWPWFTCKACFCSHVKLASANMQSLLPLTCETHLINHTCPPTQPRILCIFALVTKLSGLIFRKTLKHTKEWKNVIPSKNYPYIGCQNLTQYALLNASLIGFICSIPDIELGHHRTWYSIGWNVAGCKIILKKSAQTKW